MIAKDQSNQGLKQSDLTPDRFFVRVLLNTASDHKWPHQATREAQRTAKDCKRDLKWLQESCNEAGIAAELQVCRGCQRTTKKLQETARDLLITTRGKRSTRDCHVMNSWCNKFQKSQIPNLSPKIKQEPVLWYFRLTRCSAIAERPRCRVRYSFRQK